MTVQVSFNQFEIYLVHAKMCYSLVLLTKREITCCYNNDLSGIACL
jgi:hypothetical protein